MSSAVKPIPEGRHSIAPHLVIKDAALAIPFYEKVFGAVEIMRMPMPDGRLGHAEIQIGDSLVYLTDEFPDFDCLSPLTRGGTGVSIHLYVEDADAVFSRAVEEGATVLMPISDAFWGDRYGKLRDPFGHEWSIATHIEDLTPEQMQERMNAFMGSETCAETAATATA